MKLAKKSTKLLEIELIMIIGLMVILGLMVGYSMAATTNLKSLTTTEQGLTRIGLGEES